LVHRKGISTWEHIKLGELLQHNTLGFFCCGRQLKIHIEIKRELFTMEGVVYNGVRCLAYHKQQVTVIAHT
jgi:hypothetical protein